MIELFQFKNLLDIDKALKDERTCRDQFESLRWDGLPTCPHCQSEEIYTLKPAKYNNSYKCANPDCFKKFNCLTGTIFQGTQKPLLIWIKAIYLCTTDKKGISSPDLADKLGMTQKTAWFMLHRIREMMIEKHPEMLEGEVMADETFVGGKNKNRHADKKIPHSSGRAFKDKTPVLGLMQREQSFKRERPHKVIPGPNG
jgi:transposase-like protein